MTNGRYDIALITSGTENEFSYAVCKGAAKVAEQLDFNLYIFPGENFITHISSIGDTLFNSQHRSIPAYADPSDFDAAIISFSTIYSDVECDGAKALYERFKSIPIVTLCIEHEGCGCVKYESYTGMSMLVEHLIVDHGCTRIAFVTGADTNSDSIDRFNAYRDALARHGIEYDDSLVAHGDFIFNSHKQIDEMLGRLPELPQAICCANDHLASDAYSVVTYRNLTVGKDIIITGYDNLYMSSNLMPPLSTVNASPGNIGIHAARLAVEMIETRTPRTVTLTSSLLLRDSCGSHLVTPTIEQRSTLIDRNICIINDIGEGLRCFLIEFISEYDSDHGVIDNHSLLRHFQRVTNSRIRDTLTAAALCDLIRDMKYDTEQRYSDPDKLSKLYQLTFGMYSTICSSLSMMLYTQRRFSRSSNHFFDISPYSLNGDISSLSEVLKHLARIGVESTYIYLGQSTIPIIDPDESFPFNRLLLRGYHRGSNWTLPASDILIRRGEIINNSYVDRSRRVTLLLMPLFTMNEQQGVVLFGLDSSLISYAVALARQISSSVESLNMVSSISTQIQAVETRNTLLNTIAQRDSLTGLYNRYGFFEHAELISRDGANDGRYALVAFVDLNNLKLTNDSFGHEEGDFALRMVNDALRSVFSADSVIGRIGGDEFAVFTIPDDECSGEYLRRKLNDELASRNARSDKPYNVSVSVGFASFRCGESVIIRTMLELADRQLYADKQRKPQSILKADA